MPGGFQKVALIQLFPPSPGFCLRDSEEHQNCCAGSESGPSRPAISSQKQPGRCLPPLLLLRRRVSYKQKESYLFGLFYFVNFGLHYSGVFVMLLLKNKINLRPLSSTANATLIISPASKQDIPRLGHPGVQCYNLLPCWAGLGKTAAFLHWMQLDCPLTPGTETGPQWSIIHLHETPFQACLFPAWRHKPRPQRSPKCITSIIII